MDGGQYMCASENIRSCRGQIVSWQAFCCADETHTEIVSRVLHDSDKTSLAAFQGCSP